MRPQAPRSSRKPFTEEEITKLWKNIDLPDADVVLIFIYTGFRISELLNIKTSDVDLADKTIKGGTKTATGKDRIVPIHSKIFDLVKRRAEEGNEYLISRNGKKTGILTFRQSCWHPLMEQLGMDHVPHDARHTFRSRLDSAGANKVSIDLMMGHQSAGVGERVYTHKTLEELKEAIEKVL